jgi:hypothetical protein
MRMKFGTGFGLIAIIVTILNFAFYGGLILLAIWAIGKYLVN